MTKTEAIKELQESHDTMRNYDIEETESRLMEALKMGISALENIGHLKDRPCDVCEFNKENGCCKWTCVFCDGLFGNMRGAE